MVAFLPTMTVLGALIFIGCRVSMYLRRQGVMEVSSSSAQSGAIGGFLTRPVREAEMEERDYGLRYARVGILVVASMMILLALGLLIAIFAVL